MASRLLPILVQCVMTSKPEAGQLDFIKSVCTRDSDYGFGFKRHGSISLFEALLS